MNFSAAALRAVLDSHVPAGATGLAVALSGGPDSAALLAALLAALRAGGAALGASFRGLPLRAVHIDHGLQAAAADFREACASLCADLNIPLTIIAVDVQTPAGVSLEAAARDARYAALEEQLRPGECLLTAHHREDQAETLLLQALRGAGLAGLSAMPLCRPLGRGWHLRPVLDVPQSELLAFGAGAHGRGRAQDGGAVRGPMAAVRDPMNEDLRFDRAYLRQQIWPLIKTRWPGAGTALSRTARHAAEAQDLLERAAAADVGRLRDGEALSVPGLRALGAQERINTLRLWLRDAQVEPPSEARLTEALRQIFDADADHLPAIEWGGCALRRYRHRIFLTEIHPPRLEAALEWRMALGATLDLGPNLGVLRWVAQTGGIDAARLPETLNVRRRGGGECLKPGSRARTQSVQHLCQSHGVLPWLRDALPLVFAEGALIAVADLWLDARWCMAWGEPGLGVAWESAPIIV